VFWTGVGLITKNTQRANKKTDYEWIHNKDSRVFGKDNYDTYLDLNLFGITQRFRWINPGTFLMGSPESETGRFDNEIQHQVTLTHGFWLADTTCTQALWQAVMGKNPSHFKGEQKPVETISWLDTQEFIEKLTEKYPGIGFRLPTEAEWEYACRAGTDTPFSFGEQLTLKHANYRGTWKYEGEHDQAALQQTSDVTDFLPNSWGLYQMHGNVWEWCEDIYSEDLGFESVTDPSGPKDGALRVVRGGSWNDRGRDLRSASRGRGEPDDRDYIVGLRLSLGHELQGGGADT
jgi:formylglycine-generating enzyme required for sulfatase activity